MYKRSLSFFFIRYLEGNENKWDLIFNFKEDIMYDVDELVEFKCLIVYVMCYLSCILSLVFCECRIGNNF